MTGGRLIGGNQTGSIDGEGAQGAAIYIDQGIVLLQGCTLSDHRVTGGNGGDAISPGRRGGSGGTGAGAAIYNYGGQVTITNCVFSGNSATGGLGGKGAAGLSSGNGTSGGRGGNGGTGSAAAIYNTAEGIVAIFDSTFSSNTVTGGIAGIGGPGAGLGFAGAAGDAGAAIGAAILNASGTVTLVNSSFLGNSGTGAVGSPGTPGADLYQPGNGRSGGNALGGGVFNERGSVSLTNCTLVLNSLSAGSGGTGGSGRTSGFGSDGGNGGDGGDAVGGGIYTVSSGRSEIVNCTFSENIVIGGGPGIGGPGGGVGREGQQGHRGDQSGAALANGGGTVRLRNSILANSAFSENVAGSISDDGFNLSSDESPTLNAAGSRNRINPLLGSLTATASRSWTMTLSSNSPAIDAITVPGGNGCPLTDQRNALRVAPCDIGAFESNASFSAPALQVRTSTNQLVLSWPDSGNLRLETTSRLPATNRWLVLTNQPNTANGQRHLEIGKTNASAFFRLATPAL